MGKTRHRKWYDEEEYHSSKRKNKRKNNINQNHRPRSLQKNKKIYPDEEEGFSHASLPFPQQRNQ